ELAYGNIQVSNSGFVHIGGLINTAGSGGISVDSSSKVEIGSLNTALAGQLVIDTGASISGPSSYANYYHALTIVNNGTIAGAFTLSAQNIIINNGSISGANA